MALALANRIRETCSSPGTGAVTLLGAVTGYQTFAVIGNGNTTYYCIADQSGANWEVGIGTYSTTGPTLTRTTPLSGSSTTPVNFSSGTQDVFVMMPAEKSVGSETGYFDSNFQGTFVDGIVVDYDSASSLGRISVGTSDGIAFYNGGVAGSLLGKAYSTGDWVITRFLSVGNGTLVGGTTNPLIAAAGSANSYVQIYIHNDNTGGSASSDFAAYADNGTDASGWVDMGITSSTYNDAAYPITGINEGYIFMSAPSGAGASGNLVYATDSTGSTNAHQWYVGGFSSAKGSWKMQLTGSGLSLATPLSVGNGGTGQATQTTAFNALSPTTTKGDLIVNNGTNNIRLPVSTDAWVLTADSTVAAGVKWALAPTSTFTGGTLSSNLTLAAGTTSLVPMTMQTGTLNTTAVAGAVEFDGTVPYMSIAASTRGVIRTEQWVVLTGTNTMTSQTAVQPIFDGGGGPTNGAVTLPVGTYQFELTFAVTNLSATTGTYGFGLGGTATKTFSYVSNATKASNTLTTAAAGLMTFGTAASTAISASSTSTAGTAMIKGIIRVTVTGTIIPQLSMSSASASIVSAGSYFRVSPIGNATVATVGNWS